MKEQEKAIVSVAGRDSSGILARIAGACADVNANIIEVSQNVMGGYFTMMMLIDITELDGKCIDLQKKMQDENSGMEIHVMHEDIFNSMHRI